MLLTLDFKSIWYSLYLNLIMLETKLVNLAKLVECSSFIWLLYIQVLGVLINIGCCFFFHTFKFRGVFIPHIVLFGFNIQVPVNKC